MTAYAYMDFERDPIQGGETMNRATVPMGRGFALWQRMNAGVQLVWVDDLEGRPRAITPKQAQVLALALEMAEGVGVTMRQMAEQLKVSPSTVSRALTKLAAWGIIAYFVGRGRLSGLVIFRRRKDDGREHLRKAAKDRIRRWSQAAQRRVSRLMANVAPYVLEEGRRYDSLTSHVLDSTYIDRNIDRATTWTVEELREAGII